MLEPPDVVLFPSTRTTHTRTCAHAHNSIWKYYVFAQSICTTWHASLICATMHSCAPQPIRQNPCAVTQRSTQMMNVVDYKKLSLSYTHTHTYTHTHKDTRICLHTHTHAHTHTRAHTHAQALTHAHDSLRNICECLIHMHRDSFMCAMTHLCVPWLIYVCHDSFMCVKTHSCTPWLIHVCHIRLISVY